MPAKTVRVCKMPVHRWKSPRFIRRLYPSQLSVPACSLISWPANLLTIHRFTDRKVSLPGWVWKYQEPLCATGPCKLQLPVSHCSTCSRMKFFPAVMSILMKRPCRCWESLAGILPQSPICGFSDAEIPINQFLFISTIRREVVMSSGNSCVTFRDTCRQTGRVCCLWLSWWSRRNLPYRLLGTFP